MDDRKLSALLTAVRRGSFSKAAQELGYTQSGLTYMMNALEAELGCKLLRRSFDGVALTDQGEELLPYIHRAVAAASALAEKAQRLSGREERIRIGTFASISVNWLPKLLAGFSRENPGASIEIRVETDELRRWLDDGSIELALTDRSTAEGFDWIPLWEEPLMAAVPADSPLPDGPVTVARLLEGPFITSGDEDIDGILPPEAVAQRIQVSAADDTAILSMVEQGLGASILPALSLKRHSGLVRALPLEPTYTRVLGIAVKSLRMADPLTRKFIAHCKKTAG